MIDRTLLYNVIYALAARDGREQALFGTCSPLAREAFARSLVGNGFPELWFEVPLLGDPRFDLHVLTSVERVQGMTTFAPEVTGGVPQAFSWFASQGPSVRQLALSWDVSSGSMEHPAAQLLVSGSDPQVTCDFLDAVGRGDATPAYRAFVSRLPEGWFACYAGVFPARPSHNLRVECIPDHDLQRAYAQDPDLLVRHLHGVGLGRDALLSTTLVPRCVELARTPFALEFQFDVDESGYAATTFGASLRFSSPPGTDKWQAFNRDGATGVLMSHLAEWGLVDERWLLLQDTMFAKHIARGDDQAYVYCYPAFVKLRWRDGEPLDAKAYLIAGESLMGPR